MPQAAPHGPTGRPARAQQALARTQQELVDREAMAMIGRVTSGLVHEIRNCLSPLMLADLIFEEYSADSRIQEAAELMVEAHQRIMTLVESISSQAKGEDPTINLVAAPLSDTIRSICRFAQCDPRVRRHELLMRMQSVPDVEHDVQTIKQVLLNLIHNAAEAMDEPGRITVRLAIDEADPRAVVIQVFDQGHGIPLEIRERIFEPFFSTKGEKGMGIGLHVCREAVHRHGGRLCCDSSPGRGTVMTVQLPIRTTAPVNAR